MRMQVEPPHSEVMKSTRSGWKVIWTDEAKIEFDKVIKHLTENWSEDEVVRFIRATSNVISYLHEHPRLFRKQKGKYSWSFDYAAQPDVIQSFSKENRILLSGTHAEIRKEKILNLKDKALLIFIVLLTIVSAQNKSGQAAPAPSSLEQCTVDTPRDSVAIKRKTENRITMLSNPVTKTEEIRTQQILVNDQWLL